MMVSIKVALLLLRARCHGLALPSRRAVLGSAPFAALGAALPAAAAAAPVATALVTLDLSIARAPADPLRIAVYGGDAPESAAYFLALARGTLRCECAGAGDDARFLARDAAKKRLGERACLDAQGPDTSLVGSSLWRLVPDKRLDFGRLDSSFSGRDPPTFAAETNGDLRASDRGAVSVRRGGGAFEFTIAPGYSPGLDREDLVVVGRVVDEDLGVLDALNAIPSKRDFAMIGDVPPLGGTFARACEYTSFDPTCAQFKPLKKIVVARAGVVEK